MMKLYIFGPSAAGKTTLAKKLSKEIKIEHIDLDLIMFKIVDKKRIRAKKSEIFSQLKKIRKKESWIMEGVYLLDEFIEMSDYIIPMNLPLKTVLYRQWHRYLKDENERRIYGFKNNIELSFRIICRYISKDIPKHEDFYHWNVYRFTKYSKKFAYKKFIGWEKYTF